MNQAIETHWLTRQCVRSRMVDRVGPGLFFSSRVSSGLLPQSAHRLTSDLRLKSETQGFPLFDVAINVVRFTDSDMTRILLVSQPAIRIGLRMRLELEPDLAIVGEADEGVAALSLASMHQPDVILLEMESIGVDSPRFIKALGTTSPQSAIVVLSFRDDLLTRLEMESAGAAALVSKHDNGNRLLQIIRAAGAGHNRHRGEQAQLA